MICFERGWPHWAARLEGDCVEFSKKIAVASWAVALFLTVLSIILPACDVCVDGLLIALPLSWTEVGVASGFYFWKSKNENRHKYAMRYINKIAEKYGIDAAIRVAEVVLKD